MELRRRHCSARCSIALLGTALGLSSSVFAAPPATEQALPRAPERPSDVWLGVGFAQDLALISGSQVCTERSQLQDGFTCFRRWGTQYHGTPLEGRAGDIDSGFILATTRVYLASDLRLWSDVTLGLRVGYALAGQGPTADGGKVFFPVHAELRGQYWLSDQAFPATFSSFVFVSGGIAQIDAQGTTRVTEDTSVPPPPAQLDNPDEQTLIVYEKLGRSFAAIGAGVYLPFAERHGAVCDLKAMGLFPDSGAAFQFEQGYGFGL